MRQWNYTLPYNLIYLDPAWEYKVRSPKGKGRSAENHYPVLTADEMKKLPMADIAAKNCAMVMWTTYPMLPQALELGTAWGFKFSTVLFTWAKLNKRAKVRQLTVDHPTNWFMGMGYTTRANPEIALYFTRGKPQICSHSVRNLVVTPIEGHSKKPDRIYGDLEQLFGDVPRIEIFARQQWTKWDAIGNEIDGQDIRDALPLRIKDMQIKTVSIPISIINIGQPQPIDGLSLIKMGAYPVIN